MTAQPSNRFVFCRGHGVCRVRLQLHCAIYRPDSFVLMLRYCANLKAIRSEPTSLNRIVADKSHRVIVALWKPGLTDSLLSIIGVNNH